MSVTKSELLPWVKSNLVLITACLVEASCSGIGFGPSSYSLIHTETQRKVFSYEKEIITISLWRRSIDEHSSSMCKEVFAAVECTTVPVTILPAI